MVSRGRGISLEGPPVHYWISFCARQALGVLQPQAKGPPLNKKLFPVYRPGRSKRADWNFFFHLLKNFFLLFPLYILV